MIFQGLAFIEYISQLRDDLIENLSLFSKVRLMIDFLHFFVLLQLSPCNYWFTVSCHKLTLEDVKFLSHGSHEPFGVSFSLDF